MILHLPDSMTCPLAHLQCCQVVVTAVNDLHLEVTKLADTQLHVSGQQRQARKASAMLQRSRVVAKWKREAVPHTPTPCPCCPAHLGQVDVGNVSEVQGGGSGWPPLKSGAGMPSLTTDAGAPSS